MRAVGLGLSLAISGCFPAPHLGQDVADAVVTTDTSTAEIAVPQTCTQDDQCAGLSVAPCTVGQCDHGSCKAASVAVTCDDGDPCTTADRCDAGVCKGRAFTADEAKNWALVLHPTEGYLHFLDVSVHPSGDIGATIDLIGRVERPGTGGTEIAPSERSIYWRFTPDWRVRQADVLEDGTAGFRIIADAEDDVIMSTSDDAAGVWNSSYIRRAAVHGTELFAELGAPSVEIPGAITQAIQAAASEWFIVSDVTTDGVLQMADGSTTPLHPSGNNDVYLARVREDGRALWVKQWTSVGADFAGALIPVGDDLLFSAIASNLPFETPVGATFDGLPLEADEMAATFRVPRSGANAVVSRVPDDPRALVFGGFASDADVVATTLSLADGPNWSFALRQFFPGGAASRWSTKFGAALGFPHPVGLPTGDSLVVWPIANLPAGTSIDGWSIASTSGGPAILMGRWSADGHFRGSWSLPGFNTPRTMGKESINLGFGPAPVAILPDGSILMPVVSTGVSLGPDFANEPTSATDGILVRYSAAHVFGCSVSQ